MNHHCGILNAECGKNAAKSCRAQAFFPIPHSAFRIRSLRGLTLIELLVTIVIMVTVLAGVLPMISPNNNARKIRESARQLSSLMAQAQAQAARDGRPYGVAFREFDAGGTSYSGMALEAFTIAEPPRFSGFSEFSRVTVGAPTDAVTYGESGQQNPKGNGGTMFDPRLRGATVWQLIFWLYGQEEELPPRMIRNGDVLSIDGNLFLIIDGLGNYEGEHLIDDDGYVIATSRMHAVWLNNHGQQPPAGMKAYGFKRQPANTSDAPLQFPRGIGIDLAASGAEGVGPGIPQDFDARGGRADVTGIMFSPNGALDAVYVNGTRREGIEQVFMLMGLFENGNGTYDAADFDFSANPATAGDNAEMAGRRSRINWLNADSRWVTANRAGRIITSENNTSFDPSTTKFMENLPTDADDARREQRRRQIDRAREYARAMTGSSGR